MTLFEENKDGSTDDGSIDEFTEDRNNLTYTIFMDENIEPKRVCENIGHALINKIEVSTCGGIPYTIYESEDELAIDCECNSCKAKQEEQKQNEKLKESVINEREAVKWNQKNKLKLPKNKWKKQNRKNLNQPQKRGRY